MKKLKRQEILIELIRHHNIRNQVELKQRLEQKGVVTTQATISRDLDELHIDKNRLSKIGYVFGIKDITLEKSQKLFSLPILSFKQHRELVAIQTSSGMGYALAKEISDKQLTGVFTVIENDSSVIIIFDTARDAEKFMIRLKN